MNSLFIKALVSTLFVCLSFDLPAQVEDFASINFKRADSIAQLYPGYSLRDIRGLAEKLSQPLSTHVEKFRAIYRWVCLNIGNDYILFQRNKLKREKLKDHPATLKKWNKKFSPVVFEPLVKKHRTLCTGYAYLIRELALYAGLSCEMVNGYGRSANSNIGGQGIPNHSWNAVRLNNKWYLCDATWSSGVIDPYSKNFVKKYNDSYFLLTPSQFVRNHYPSDTSWMLLSKKPTLEEFLNRPLVYGSMFQYKIDSQIPERFNVTTEKGKSVSFQFKINGEKVVDKTVIQTVTSSNVYEFSPDLCRNEDGVSSFEHAFNSKGEYIVHIQLNGEYVFSYCVTVK